MLLDVCSGGSHTPDHVLRPGNILLSLVGFVCQSPKTKKKLKTIHESNLTKEGRLTILSPPVYKAPPTHHRHSKQDCINQCCHNHLFFFYGVATPQYVQSTIITSTSSLHL